MKKIKRNSLFIIVVSAIILLFSVSLFRSFDNNEVKENQFELFLHEQKEEREENNEYIVSIIMVDVKGAVNLPGVYEVDEGDRVINVIKKAGGFHEDANKDLINLAALLEDEMVIYVPFIDEEYNNNEIVQPIFSSKDDGKININHASNEELQTIPGIGPSKAAAIITNREEHGNFKQIEDIVRVTGIGQKTFENIKDFIKVQ